MRRCACDSAATCKFDSICFCPGRRARSSIARPPAARGRSGLQKKGTIKSFDTVFLDPHGGDLNGFLLMRGEPSQLDGLMSSPEWIAHVTGP
jgi:hypothetical protein